MFTQDRTWLPIGLTAVVTLFINIAIVSATTLPVWAGPSVPTSTEAATPLTDRTQESFDADPADASTQLPAIEAAASPVTGYRADGRFEQDTISTAGLTAHQRLDAAAESAARAQAQRADEQAAAEQAAAEQAAAEQAAAEQAAAELHAVSHTTEPDPAPKPAPADRDHDRAERAADGIPFDWRGHGITFKVGCHPDQSRCAWGTFDYRVDEVWLSSAAFASDARLRYVLAHELAHAWQWSTNLDDREADLTDFGVSTSDGIEYGADCVAEAWGHPVATYWDCPPDAVAHMRSVFATA